MAMNDALAVTTGEVVVVIDADARIHPFALRFMAAHFVRVNMSVRSAVRLSAAAILGLSRWWTLRKRCSSVFTCSLSDSTSWLTGSLM